MSDKCMNEGCGKNQAGFPFSCMDWSVAANIGRTGEYPPCYTTTPTVSISKERLTILEKLYSNFWEWNQEDLAEVCRAAKKEDSLTQRIATLQATIKELEKDRDDFIGVIIPMYEFMCKMGEEPYFITSPTIRIISDHRSAIDKATKGGPE